MQGVVSKLAKYVLYVWLAYLPIGNLVLNTGWGPALVNRKPEAFTLEWQHGLTLWPGHAILWNVQATGHVRQIIWRAESGRTHGRIALMPLARRTLRIPALTAHDVHVVINDATHDRPPPEARPDGWTLRFDAIRSDSLRSIRFKDYRIEGEGEAVLGIVKQLRGGPLEILPSRLEMRSVSGHDDDLRWLSDGTIDASFALAHHRREEVPGWQRVKLASGHLNITAQTPGLQVELDEHGHWSADIATESGGTLEADIGFEQGSLRPDGRLALSIPLHAGDAQGARWDSKATVNAMIGETVDLSIHLPPPPGDRGRIFARLQFAGRELPIDGGWSSMTRRLWADIDLRWHFESLRWLSPVFAHVPWLDMQGAGEVDADLKIKAGELAVGSRFDIPAVDARIDVLDNRITGRGSASGAIENDNGTPTTRVSLNVDRFRMAPRDTPDHVHVEGQDLTLDLRADAARLSSMHESLDAQLRFRDARVPDLTVYNRYLPARGMRFAGGSGTLSGDLRLDPAGDLGQGQVQVQARRARIRLGELDIAGNVNLDARLRRADIAQRRFDLSGSTIAVSNVRALDDSRAVDRDWWANATFDRGQLTWRRPFEVDAQLTARAKNAGLLLSLFAHKRDYPRWVFGLVDAGDAHVDGRVRMQGDRLDLEPFQVRNDRFNVKTRLRLDDRHPVGDLLIAWRRLAVGLEIAAGERDWHMLKATDWFESRSLPK